MRTLQLESSMKNVFVFVLAVFSFFGVGCAASHDAFYASDPTTSVQFECTRTSNGARHCVRRIESTVPGGAAMYGGGYSPEMYGGYGQVAHPRVVMAPRGPQPTEAERAMEDVPGGVVLLHPTNDEYATKEDLAIVVRQTVITKKKVEELKKGGQKQPSSGEAAQH